MIDWTPCCFLGACDGTNSSLNEIQCTQVDTQQLDRQINAIMAEIDHSAGAWVAHANSAHTTFHNRHLFDVSNEKII